jgi:hypothetical protein
MYSFLTEITPCLLVEDKYTVEHFSEDTWLLWKEDASGLEGGRIELADHYGDPTCAVINSINGWCATGGEGLVVSIFNDGFPSESKPINLQNVTQRELWRRRNPPPIEPYWGIEGMWLFEDDLIRVVVDPISDHAGLYEVNVQTLVWRKL